MTKVFCDDCAAYMNFKPETTVAVNGAWTTTCPSCGRTIPIDPEDYTVPIGTKITVNGDESTIRQINKDCDKFTDIAYKISGLDIWLTRDQFQIASDWRKLRAGKYGIERVCHYPRNQATSNAPCYNCIDRTKCNADLFQALADYESTGLTPDQVKTISDLLQRHGLTVIELVELVAKHHKLSPY